MQLLQSFFAFCHKSFFQAPISETQVRKESIYNRIASLYINMYSTCEYKGRRQSPHPGKKQQTDQVSGARLDDSLHVCLPRLVGGGKIYNIPMFETIEG